MDENASRAVFVGISVLVAVITMTLIINFYDAAKGFASGVNTYDVSTAASKYENDILLKDMITGNELRYLLNNYVDEEIYNISIYKSSEDKLNGNKMDIDRDDYWKEEYQTKLDYDIRPNYNYELKVEETDNTYKIEAVFRY